MDYEKILMNYSKNKLLIQAWKQELDNLLEGNSLGAQVLSDMPRGGGVSSKTENLVLGGVEKERRELQECIKDATTDILMVDTWLGRLDLEKRTIIENKYIIDKPKSWKEISMLFDYYIDKDTLRRKKNKALEEIIDFQTQINRRKKYGS